MAKCQLEIGWFLLQIPTALSNPNSLASNAISSIDGKLSIKGQDASASSLVPKAWALDYCSVVGIEQSEAPEKRKDCHFLLFQPQGGSLVPDWNASFIIELSLARTA